MCLILSQINLRVVSTYALKVFSINNVIVVPVPEQTARTDITVSQVSLFLHVAKFMLRVAENCISQNCCCQSYGRVELSL